MKCVGTPIRSRTASGVAGARPEPLPDVSGYGTVLHGSDVRDGLAVRGEDVADADSDVETWLRANGRVTVIEPGVVDTELPTHITHDATREAVQRGYDAATVKPEEVAEIIAFVLARPRHLAINEILLRPTSSAESQYRETSCSSARCSCRGPRKHRSGTETRSWTPYRDITSK